MMSSKLSCQGGLMNQQHHNDIDANDMDSHIEKKKLKTKSVLAKHLVLWPISQITSDRSLI